MKRQFILMLVALAVSGQLIAQMRVHQINVGQGSATLLEFPCAAVLIDAGGENNPLFSGTDALKTYLDNFFATRPDLNHTLQCVYLTHPHKDHTHGVPVLLQSPYTIKNAVTDGLKEGSGKWGQLKLHDLDQAADNTADPADDVGFEAVTTGEIDATGLTNSVIDAVNCPGTDPVIKILWGTSKTNPGWSNTVFENENNHSLVIRVDYDEASMLITGDLEENAIESLLEKVEGTSMLDADVYLVGHHGSKNGTTLDLLDAITPEIALIGMGESGRETSWTAWAYGHPNKGILDKLQSKVSGTRSPQQVQAGNGAKNFISYTVSKAIYATGWDGDIVLEGNSSGAWKKAGEDLVPPLVNLNTASAAQLETLPGIGAVKAQAIVDFRSTNGNFTSLADLDNVPGIGPATIELVREWVVI
jgi:competence protein ComEC